MAHFLPPELVRQVNKLEWPNTEVQGNLLIDAAIACLELARFGGVIHVHMDWWQCGILERTVENVAMFLTK